MIKGHCEIILSENGKEIQHTHDDNIVTNALQKIFDVPEKYYLSGDSLKVRYYANLMPIIDKGIIGGVALLKKAIQGTDEELKEKVILPIGVENIAGHSGKNTNLGTIDSTLGVYNAAESGKTENGFRFVWDFPTNRANGTIECVCLTSAIGGGQLPTAENLSHSESILSPVGGRTKLASGYSIIGINNNGELILIRRGTSTDAVATVAFESNLGLFDIIFSIDWNTNPLTELSSFQKYTISKKIDSNNCQYTDRGLCYLSGNVLTIWDGITFDEKETYTLPSLSWTDDKRNWFVKGDYFYAIKSADKKIYKVNLSDLTDVFEIEHNTPIRTFEGEVANYILLSSNSENYHSSDEYLFDGKNISRMYYDEDGITSHIASFQTPNKLYSIRTGGQYSGDSSDNYQMYRYESAAITIDNLETPVTKTNAQTMKVIYTVTQEE